MEIITLIVGVLIGSGIGYFFLKSKQQTETISISDVINEKNNKIAQLENSIEHYQKEIKKQDLEINFISNQLRNTEISVAKKEIEHTNLINRFNEYKTEVQDLQVTFKTEFKNIASELVKKQSEDFNTQNELMLKPFKEQLISFEIAVHSQMKESIEKAATFKEQIEQLKTLNIKISEEASNLTNALKGDNKLQGNWGELILERVLESSGLEKGQEYKTQVSLVNADADRIMPDAVIYLPDDKHIIIDSKVSLTAYERYVNETDSTEKDKHLKAHITSVKTHVKGLSDKKYQTAEKLTSPDFILLFIPIEASFGAAVKEDVGLFNFAWDKNVVIVSPSTLLATLKTVAALWKQEKQNKNVLKIAEESGKLYDKFVGFMQDIDDIERSFEKTTKQFGEAQKKLYSGTGNIVSRIEKIKKLGAKASKKIDEKYLED
jgi:DNA recombination protein RmuC|tara:strand:- start:407 stop:1708 length:1302 start_codon:yes stop_codon:yes gene_type:complete